MRITKKLTTIALTIQLAVIPFQTSLADCSYDDDPALKKQKDECTQASKEWVCELNRCLTKEDAIDMRNEVVKCQALETDAERKKCFDDLAYQKSDSPTISDKSSDTMAMGVYGITVAMVAMSYLSKKENRTSCTSKTIFKGAASAFLMAEIYQYFMLGKKLEKLHKEYEEKTMSENQYNAQVDAFNYLKEEQEAIRDIAKKKKTVYMALTAAYGAAAVVAAYELVTQTGCGAKKTSFFNGIFAGIFPTACAAGDAKGAEYGEKKSLKSYLPVLLGGGLTAMSAKYTKFFSTSAGILTISGIATIFSQKLSAAAGKVEKQASENIEKIDAALNEFTSDQSAFCPNGRDDLSNPRCYCYSSDGSKNEEHSASATCQSLWKQDDLHIETGDYKTAGESNMGCLTWDERYDPNCDCKRMINPKTGENACKKAVPGTIGFGNLGTALSIPQIADGINGITSGNLGAAEISGNLMTKQATRNKKITDEFLRKFNEGKKNPLKLVSETDAQKFLKSIATPKLLNAAKSGALANQLSTAHLSAPPANKAMKAAIEKSGIKRPKYTGKKKSKGPSKQNDEFNFNLGQGEAGISSGRDAISFDQKKGQGYVFKDEQINSKKDESIWKIITNRYNNSAVKRLFKDEDEKEK
ncbi:MAG: hypothetical protein KAQ98_12325 [Bacteriovoracaceae bacterium]|nr:hypothetical protein [Bacteriovoracaceae bacterium]